MKNIFNQLQCLIIVCQHISSQHGRHDLLQQADIGYTLQLNQVFMPCTINPPSYIHYMDKTMPQSLNSSVSLIKSNHPVLQIHLFKVQENSFPISQFLPRRYSTITCKCYYWRVEAFRKQVMGLTVDKKPLMSFYLKNYRHLNVLWHHHQHVNCAPGASWHRLARPSISCSCRRLLHI